MRLLLYFRVAANLGADWAEDVCSLERVGLLPAGTLSVEFMLFAEYCQLALAIVEIWVTSARARKEAELTLLAEEAPRVLLLHGFRESWGRLFTGSAHGLREAWGRYLIGGAVPCTQASPVPR